MEEKKWGVIMRTINISEAQPGMTLARTIINSNLIVVLAENTLLSAVHITRLKFLGIQTLSVKDEYDLSPQNSIVQSMLSRSHAFATDYQEVLRVVEEIFQTTIQTRSVPAAKMKDIVSASITPMVKQSGVMDYLYDLKHINHSVYNHSLRVSILSGVLAKWLQYNDTAIKDVILAGFLHDIGKTQLEQRIVEKNIENLSEEDYDTYMQHTTNGYHLLSENNELPDGVKRAALQHHEKMDGSGFPFNAGGDEIHAYAKIVAVADLYDNITTEREGFIKNTPFTAMAKLSESMFSELDPEVCMAFLLNVQQVFIGSTVLLSNQARGTIIQYPNDYASLPLVRLSTGEVVDLNHQTDVKIIEYNPA